MTTFPCWATASRISATLCSPIVLTTIGFFVEAGASSIALGFAGLVLLGWRYVFDIILGKLIEIGRAEFYEDADILLDVATHLLLRILN